VTSVAPSNVRNLVISLLRDAERRQAFAAEPAATLARHGFEGFTDGDVAELVGHVAASMPADQAAPVALFGEHGWDELLEPASDLEPLIGVAVELEPEALAEVSWGVPEDGEPGWTAEVDFDPVEIPGPADHDAIDDPTNVADNEDPFDFDLG